MNDFISVLLPEIISWRHHLHAHPELGFREIQTADFVAEKLRSFGLSVDRGCGGTGVVGVLEGKRKGKHIGLRAEMDGLPILEKNIFPHVSKNSGSMHACGHDGHMAMLLGAAKLLSESREFSGTVFFLFQPAEEVGGAGALKMIHDGFLERYPLDFVFALHNMPDVPEGNFSVPQGHAMASYCTFRINVRGKGGHTAMPEKAINPVTAAAELIGMLELLKFEKEKSIFAISQVNAGEAVNSFPEVAEICGTCRTFSLEAQDFFEAGIRRVSAELGHKRDVQVTVEFLRSYPATINTPEGVRFASRAAQEIVGSRRVDLHPEPSMCGEDFSYFLERIPGAYIWIGSGGRNLHQPLFDFPDQILENGVKFWMELVKNVLSSKK